jgi:hypothetical protein
MTNVNSETQFREVAGTLDNDLQRQLATQFTEHVLELTSDSRIANGVGVASNPGATTADLAASFKTVKAATIESHTRCGSEGDWKAQAAYFVARACEATLMPEGYKVAGSALQAATSARMAQTAYSIDAEESGETGEREAQYQILNTFLSKRGLS